MLLQGPEDAEAAAAMAEAMGSSCDVSGAAHLPAHVVGRLPGLAGPKATTAFRLEGVAPSVAHRRDMLAAILKRHGPTDSIAAEPSQALWRAIRDVLPFAADGIAGDRTVWRVSTAPSRGFEIAEMITPSTQMFYDWAGGLIWIASPPSDDGGARAIRDAVAKIGGHATLVRAPAAIRAAAEVFQPQDEGAAALTKRVKDSFDPKGILNPGRMWAGV